MREYNTTIDIHFRMKGYSSGKEKMIPEGRFEIQEAIKRKEYNKYIKQ